MTGNVSQPGPGAHEERRRLIVIWHAQGHDELDRYGIPRFEDGLELPIAVRVSLLADRGGVERQPRPAPDIHAPESPARNDEHETENKG